MEKISKNLAEEQAKKLVSSIRYGIIPINEMYLFRDLSFIRVRVKKSVFKRFSFNGLLKGFEQILYLPGIIGDVKFSKALFDRFNLPILIPESDVYRVKNLIFDLIITSSKLSLESYDNRQFFIIETGNMEDLKFYKLKEEFNGVKKYYSLPIIYFTRINSDSIFVYFDLESATSVLIFNLNNPVSDYIYKKMDYIIENLELKEVFMDIINDLGSMKYSYNKEDFRRNIKKFYELIDLKGLISLKRMIKNFENFNEKLE